MAGFKNIDLTALVDEAQDAQPGDDRAFCELVRRHQAGVLANCFHLTKSADDAEDLAQEVFVKAFFALGKFRREANFKTWINRIKINHCLNYLRKRRQEIFIDAASPEAALESEMWVLPTATGSGVDRSTVVRQVLSSLPDTLRVPLILCDMDSLRYQEAADQLGIGLSALKMRIKRARALFRERFTTTESEVGNVDRDEHEPTRYRTA